MSFTPATRRTSASARPRITWLLASLFFVATTAAAPAQEAHEHDEGHAHEPGAHDHAGLHFTHPLIAESVTPDTKVRMDHQFFDFPDGTRENSSVLEAEYAFHRAVSLEVGLPYSYTAGTFGNLRALLKLANYALEDSGVLLGYGVGVTFPTNGAADEAGHLHEEEGHAGQSHTGVRLSRAVAPPPRFHGAAEGVRTSLGTEVWEVEPYLNVGFRGGPWEVTAWTRFAVPFHQAEQHDVGSELRWNLATLFHASSRLHALLELDGSSGISGHPVGEDVVFASPGLRLKPLAGQPLWIGTAVGIPVATGVPEDPFDVRWKTSLFWHFPR